MAEAAPIQIYHEGNSSIANEIYKELTNTYSIPEELIEISKTSECKSLKTQFKLELCLNKNGELVVLSADKDFLNRTLKVFRN